MVFAVPRVTPDVSSRPTIAVVDKDEAVRDALHFLLDAYGFTVISYSTGGEFLAELPNISLLIVEQELPGLSGLHVVRRFRRAVDRPVPVLMFSAILSSDTQTSGLDMGVMRALQKPDVLDLVQAVQNALSGTCVNSCHDGLRVGAAGES